MQMKYRFLLLVLISLMKLPLISQCIIDSVQIQYYTIMSIHDNISYKSIDSTILYDQPNSIWLDEFSDGKLTKRYVNGTNWNDNYYTLNYNEKDQLESIAKHTKGFQSEIQFIYNDSTLIRIIDKPKAFKISEYDIEILENGYKLHSTNEDSNENSWFEIDTKLISKSECFNYGLNELLNIQLNLNRTNSKENPIEDYDTWPSDEDITVNCKVDSCGNTTQYARIINETNAILELYTLKYFYNE